MSDMSGYETVKPISGSTKKTPIVKITTAEGMFLKGVLLAKKFVKDEENKNDDGTPKEKLIATFRLIETNAPMIKKGAQGYAPVENVKAGEDVTIYGAPTRLTNALRAIEDGGKYEVMIVYGGKKSEVVNGRKVKPHVFSVGKRLTVPAAAAEMDDEGIPD